VDEELFSELRTLQDVWDYVWSGYTVTIDARRRVMLWCRYQSSRDPRRVQLSRKPGWRKPPGAVVVSRPSRWGNPYPVATYGRDQAVALFRRYLADHPELVEAARHELAGKDLACWCKRGELCHADI
jgi:hypothetical protein